MIDVDSVNYAGPEIFVYKQTDHVTLNISDKIAQLNKKRTRTYALLDPSFNLSNILNIYFSGIC
jgi:hypothetical protein